MCFILILLQLSHFRCLHTCERMHIRVSLCGCTHDYRASWLYTFTVQSSALLSCFT
eukprot:m.284386 g.284386  ORF g.284386 m.284386 type:complete len:56 (-) comp85108_c0_seq1:91-258(-)